MELKEGKQMNNNLPVNDLSESQKGISNTTLAVLVILALVVTIIGTLAVISGTDTTSSGRGPGQYTTNIGKVSFQVIPSQTQSQETGVSTPDETN
jgi:hypothetical protein